MNLPDQSDAHFIRNELKTGKDDLPDSILEFIEEKKLFKLFIPAQFGGLELPLPDALEVLEHCAWIDGDFGWQVNIPIFGNSRIKESCFNNPLLLPTKCLHPC
ncbi:MAG: hypothetical protein WED82_08610 [Balneolales bacterium]